MTCQDAPAALLVSGVHTITEYPPIALGMCMTYAKHSLSGEGGIAISEQLVSDVEQLTALLGDRRFRHVLLFSNYLWNTKLNLRMSQLAKLLDPTCVTIHGGPDTPAYTGPSRDLLQSERHIDYIVAGEGEETLRELLQSLVSVGADRGGIQGLRYLDEHGSFTETAPRIRAADLNRFPSPYLSGFFERMDPGQWQSATIETYRGCPYGCTFCDWGSNIASRIRTFDLQRAFDEIEWVARMRVGVLWIADSNFGMTDRDVEITRKVCEVKRRLGFPRALVLTFAKNVKTRVLDIVQQMADADLIGTGIISLQTLDPATLRAVRRSNIKPVEYEKLRRAFAARNLPLNAELMMALPGSTLDAFKRDLDYHFDLPVEVSVNRCLVLPNSPMADPAYLEEYRIEFDDEKRVTQTSTMSRAEIELGVDLCRVFYGAHRFGILRYLLRWLQWERGMSPLDVMHDLLGDPTLHADYPVLGDLASDARVSSPYDLATALASFRERMRRGCSWSALSSEFLSWASRRYNLEPNEALESLGELQSLVMPSAGRSFPAVVPMRNDVVRWYSDWLGGNGARLETYGPDVLSIEDPHALSDRPCLESSAALPGTSWELDYALVRVRRESARKLKVTGEDSGAGASTLFPVI